MKLIGDYFMKKVVLLVSIISVILLGCGTENNQDKEVENARNDCEQQKLMVSAAASLTDAMDEITEKYEAEHPGIDLEFNFAGSGKLAQQIQQGAPVDVFISANESWMDTLIHDEEIDKSERLDVTGNRLVMITQKDRKSTRLNSSHVAISYAVFCLKKKKKKKVTQTQSDM